jgi:hypothetical protein
MVKMVFVYTPTVLYVPYIPNALHEQVVDKINRRNWVYPLAVFIRTDESPSVGISTSLVAQLTAHL